MEVKPAVAHMWIDIDIVDTTGVEGRGATLDTVDYVALFKKQSREQRSVLTGNPSDKGNFVATYPAPTRLLD